MLLREKDVNTKCREQLKILKETECLPLGEKGERKHREGGEKMRFL